MSEKKLQFKLLSKSGELLNVVTCYGGQVSVFRSSSGAELKPYQRALAGIPGAEKISITVLDKPYLPDEHILIGFGERFSAGPHESSPSSPLRGHLTVYEYLQKTGLAESSIQSVLVSYGLEAYGEKMCSELPPGEERLLRLVSATYSKDKVLVLNDPFETLPSTWRERIAELLVGFVRSKGEIVVIPSLSYRPAYWIDNESVARIQVGENIQKTIGFASGATDINTILSQVREEFQKEEKQGEAPPSRALEKVAPAIPSAAYAQSPTAKPSLLIVTGISIVVAVILGVTLGLKIMGAQKGSQSNLIQAKLVGETPTNGSILQSGNTHDGVEPVVAHATSPISSTPTQKPSEPAVDAKPRIVYVLDEYPAEIKKAVLSSFEGSVDGALISDKPSELKSPRLSSEQGTQKRASRTESAKTASELLNVLQAASGTGDGLPDRVSPPASSSSLNQQEMTNMDPEQRREMIRQKFLQAIQRAAEQKK